MPEKNGEFSVEEILAEFADKEPKNPISNDKVDSIVNEIISTDKSIRKTKELTFYELDDTWDTDDELEVAFQTDDKKDKKDKPAHKLKEKNPSEDLPPVHKPQKTSDEKSKADEKPPASEKDIAIDVNKIKQQSERHVSFSDEYENSFEFDRTYSHLSISEINELLSSRLKYGARSVFFTVLFAALAVILDLSGFFSGIFPKVTEFLNKPSIYPGISLILLLLSVAFAAKPFSKGIKGVFSFKTNKYSLPALAALAAGVQNLFLLIFPAELSNPNIHIYSSLACVSLAFCCIGYKHSAQNAKISFKTVSGKYDKYAQMILNDEYAAAYTKGLVPELPVFVYSRKTGGISNFVGRAFSDDLTDFTSKGLVPSVLAVSLLTAATTGYLLQSVAAGLTVFAAACVMCSPFAYSDVCALSLKKVSRRLIKFGAAIVGSGGIDDFAFTNSMLVKAKQLFPDESVTLHGIKTFGATRIDEAILDAASVACAGDSILSGLFMQIISGKKEMLRPVENLVYEDGLGLSAWTGQKRVLIGTRDLMLGHGVDAPSKDYEKRIKGEKNELVYLSVGGELAAVFVLELSAEPVVAHAMRMLEYRGISLVINTSDPIITTNTLSRLFKVDKDNLKIMPARLKEQTEKICEYTDEAESSVMSNGTFYSDCAAVCEAKKLKSSFMLQMVILMAGIISGFLVVGIFAFLRNFSQLSSVFALAFNGMWALLSIVIAKLK